MFLQFMRERGILDVKTVTIVALASMKIYDTSIHEKKKPCEICDFMFSVKSRLKRHCSFVHEGKEIPNQQSLNRYFLSIKAMKSDSKLLDLIPH